MENGEKGFTQEVERILRDIWTQHVHGYTLTDERMIQIDKEEMQRRKKQEYDSGIDIIDDSSTTYTHI